MRRPRKGSVPAAELVKLLDDATTYAVIGVPRRRRKLINGFCVDATTSREIRRWRSGQVSYVLPDVAASILDQYEIPSPL